MNLLFDNLQACLLNVFLVYFCFSMYFQFIETNMNTKTNELIVFLVSGFSIVFCMTFPITVFQGVNIDFRQVPLIIGALYGGRKVAFLLNIVLLVYYFQLSLPHFSAAVIVSVLLFGSLYMIIPLFKQTVQISKKVAYSLLASLLGSLFALDVSWFFFSFHLTIQDYMFIAALFLLQLAGTLFFVGGNEKSRKNAVLSKEVAKLEKLKTVSTFAASISHEVRNPLTVTKGFLQLLQEPGVSDAEKQSYIQIALEALEKAEGTITDYLTFAKPSLENVRILSLSDELLHIKSFIEPYAAMNNVEIQMDLKKEIYIVSEKEKFHQCLINIVKNGIEAMPKGGKLMIQLKSDDTCCFISVTDTGVGMNQEQLDRLGSPFFTTKDIGTGLGTMVVYSVVKAMGGTIHVQSEPGKGTCFTIRMPAADYSDLAM